MAIRRRRRRWPRRSRWRGRRKYLYRRRWRPHRRHFRRKEISRTTNCYVRYYPSRRRKRISVRGWEPLGNVCYNTVASSEATPYNDLDITDPNIFTRKGTQLQGQWQGQWGHHFFTFENLLRRAQYYFNYWSGDWQGYDYLSFRGGYIWLPRLPAVSWIFYLDNSIQSNPTDKEPEGKYKFEKSWVHPGILLNRPGSRLMVNILQQPYKSLFRRIRVRPPAAWEGQYRMDVAKSFLLFHWAWTTCILSAPFFDYYCSRKGPETAKDTCILRPWFMGCAETYEKFKHTEDKQKIEKLKQQVEKDHTDTRALWVNRKHYLKSDCVAIPDATDKNPSNFFNWGPFLAQNILTGPAYEASVYFRYKLFFKVSGDSLYRRLPSKDCDNGLFPPAPGFKDGPCAEVSSRPIHRRKRPLTTSEILPGDLDESGILTERAYQRIIRSHRDFQSTRLGDESPNISPRKRVRFREPHGIRKRKRARQLLRILLGGRGESRGGGPPPNTPPITEPLDLLLNFPK
uniref:Capsid protein n=1 Tax=Torque teno Leptonychotes weddellii virus-1 TaxID=2012676 RepID=A0A1Z2RVL9_9VIRU|nr:ORF1 [Torque teno Leptonychotes weddellii virus 1]